MSILASQFNSVAVDGQTTILGIWYLDLFSISPLTNTAKPVLLGPTHGNLREGDASPNFPHFLVGNEPPGYTSKMLTEFPTSTTCLQKIPDDVIPCTVHRIMYSGELFTCNTKSVSAVKQILIDQEVKSCLTMTSLDMISYVIWYDMTYMIRYDMYDTIWHVWYDMTYMMRYDIVNEKQNLLFLKRYLFFKQMYSYA